MIFLAPTIQYRIELTSFSFAVMEPIVLVASAFLILRNRARGQRLHNPRGWPEMLRLGLVGWALLIRPWAQDWKHGLSDVRDWIIPVVAFLSLRTCLHHAWGKGIKPLLAVVMVTAVLGIYQGAAGRFCPFMSAGARLKLNANWEALIGPGWDQSSIFSLCTLHSERARLWRGG